MRAVDDPAEGVAQEAAGIFSSARRVAALTLLSRILGLVRDSVCAAIFGSGPEWGAFAFAFRIPNLFRRLFGEGALSAAFIPTFNEVYERQGPDVAWRLFRRTLGALLAVLGGLLALLYAVSLVAGAFLGGAPRWYLVFPLVNVLLPYLPLVCVTAFFGAALEARKHFTAPAASQVVTNVFWIGGAVAAFWFGAGLSQKIFLVAVGTVLGGVASLAMHVPVLTRSRDCGTPLRPEWDFNDPGLSRVARSMAPIVLGLTIVQVNVLLDGLIARIFISNEADGHLYFANRLFQFPLAMLGISLGTAVFPSLTQLAARGRDEELRRVATGALDVTLFLALPAAFALTVLDRQTVSLLFEYGRFSALKTDVVAPILACYALGLPAHCGVQVLVRMFYTAGDMRTPVRVALLAMVVNLCLNLALVFALREAGLALATTVSAYLQFALLFAIAARRLKMIDRRAVLVRLLRSTALAALMGLAMSVVAAACRHALPGGALKARAVAMFVPAALGAAVYLGVAAVLRFDELTALKRRSKAA